VTAPTPTAAIGTVASSLAIVLGLFAALVWFSKRFAPAGAAALPKEAVELLGRTPLDGRQTMQLIRVGNRLLLVALSASGAATLTEITDPLEVEHLAGLCRRGKSGSATASFSAVLSQLASEPADQPPRTRARGAA
ncbi:MAG: flagellar biosynthetic protein FliO, partial [Planctomycetaceae bacterium]|nr:flagellar biosynthetic protein FliO [Planctomycetaceae bacterium]